jgi:hypothetical protein
MLASLREVAQRALHEFRKNLALADSDAIVPPPYTLIKTCLCRARHKPARLPPANKLADLVP